MTNKLCHTMVTYTKHKGPSKLKDSTTSNLKGTTNPINETKTTEKLDNYCYIVSNTIKMDDNLHKESDNLYDVVQISTDKESNNENDVMMDVNPSYNTIGVNDNLCKVKGSNKPTHNVVRQTNQKSNVRMKKVDPYYGVNTVINDNT